MTTTAPAPPTHRFHAARPTGLRRTRPWHRLAYIAWLLPRRHEAHFDSSPRHEYASLARLLGDILRRINKSLGSPPYNLLIHTAPVVEPAAEFYHWHVEIIPKLTRVAGFEWATGFYVNPTAPEEAAQVLREARG